MPSSTKAGTKPLRFSPTRFFVTLQEFSAFLYIKAVWGIEEKLGYELETVLNSTFCYKLHQRTPDTRPAAILWPNVECKGTQNIWGNKTFEGFFTYSSLVSWFCATFAHIIHVEVFWNFVSICNTDRNKYIPKLKGTKKCNLRFADSGIRLSSFYIIKTR